MNRRAVAVDADFKTREADGRKYIEGYFAVFGGKYHLWDNAYETVDRGAFDLEADVDVRALTNHDTTLVLGRTTNGTLTLKVDERGLWGSVKINREDGCKVYFEDGSWVICRFSGTEPLLRIASEGNTRHQARNYIQLWRSLLKL